MHAVVTVQLSKSICLFAALTRWVLMGLSCALGP